MSKAMSILGSVLFFVAAPVVVAGLVPWWIMRWEFQPAFLGFEVTRVIGVMLIIAGIPGIVDSFARVLHSRDWARRHRLRLRKTSW